MKIRIRIWIWELFNFFKVILHLWEIGPKMIYSMIIQKSIGPNMFSWIRHYGVEVCAPPSALILLICIYPSWSDGSYNARRSNQKEKCGVKYNCTFSARQPMPDAPQNTGPIVGAWPPNIVQVDQYTIFNDSANIAEHSPSGLSTQGSTPSKRLVRNGRLGKWLAIADPSYCYESGIRLHTTYRFPLVSYVDKCMFPR